VRVVRLLIKHHGCVQSTYLSNNRYAYICTYVHTYKVKVKFTLEEATKAQRGSRGIAILFL